MIGRSLAPLPGWAFLRVSQARGLCAGVLEPCTSGMGGPALNPIRLTQTGPGQRCIDATLAASEYQSPWQKFWADAKPVERFGRPMRSGCADGFQRCIQQSRLAPSGSAGPWPVAHGAGPGGVVDAAAGGGRGGASAANSLQRHQRPLALGALLIRDDGAVPTSEQLVSSAVGQLQLSGIGRGPGGAQQRPAQPVALLERIGRWLAAG